MAIVAENITLGYGQRTIIEDLSIKIPEGAFCSVIGPNGCGKSTLIKGLSRNLKIRCGAVTIQKKDLHSYDTKLLARKMAYVAQSPHVPEQFTVRELVGNGRFPHLGWLGRLSSQDQRAIDQAMERTEMTLLADRDLSALSGGERQRAWIAMALAQEADILLLDEPTTFLDIAHQFQTLEIIDSLQKQTHTTVLMVLHDLNQAARYSDLIFVMHEGMLVAQGAPKEVISEELLRKVFSIETRIMHDQVHDCPYFIPLRRR